MGEQIFLEFILGVKTTLGGKIIIYLIYFLFVVGFCDLIRHRKNIVNLEMPNLNKVKENIKEVISANLKPKDAEELRDRLTMDVNKESVAFKRVEGLCRIRLHGGGIDQWALSEVLAGKQAHKAGFVRYILGILIMLGLIGTVWGLNKTITQIQPFTDIGAISDFKRLAEAIKGTLAGMNTAFATTLVGLITTIILGLFYYRFQKLQESFLVEVEEVTTISLSPMFFPTSTDLVSSMAKAFEDSSIAMEVTTRMIGETSWLMESKLDQLYSFAGDFKDSTGTLLKGLEDMSKIQSHIDKSADIMSKSQDNLAQLLTTSMLPSFQEEAREIIDIIQEYKESQMKFVNELRNLINESFSSRIAGVLEENREQINRLFLNHRLLVRNLYLNHKGLIERLERAAEGFNNRIEHEEKQLTILNDLSQGIKNLNHLLNERLPKKIGFMEGLILILDRIRGWRKR